MQALDAQGRQRFSWPARVVIAEDEQLVLCGDWERLLRLPDGRAVPVTNRSLEFYDRRKPYTVAALFGKGWELEEYYARLIRPPRWDLAQKTLTIEMLGLDVRVTPAPEYEYEFLEHEGLEPEGSKPKQRLSSEDEAKLREGIFELLEELERREGPFDPDVLREWVERARRM